MSQIPVNLSLPPQTIGNKCSGLESAHGWSDFLGIAASIACAIHCAALPVFIAVLPAWGLGWMVHESVHKWMFAVCVLIAVVAFLPSLFRHRNVSPIAIGSVGLVCIGIGAFSPGTCGCSSCSRCAVAAEADASGSDSKNDAESNSNRFKMVLSRIGSAPQALTAVASLEPEVADVGQDDNGVLSGSVFCLVLLTIWITPVGGVLLVAAHLLNHHLGTFCRC